MARYRTRRYQRKKRKRTHRIGKIDYVKAVALLKGATRKRYRVNSSANCWVERGCIGLPLNNTSKALA